MPVGRQDLGTLNTVDETCEKLRVSRQTLYRLMASQSIEWVTIRGRRYVTDRAIIDNLNRHANPVAKGPRSGRGQARTETR